MLTELKREAFEANLSLPRHGLVHLNFGNASALDRRRGLFAIKPSGVDYSKLRVRDMVLVDLEGKRVEGTLRPSSDTPTHAAIYRGFAHAGGVVHTHSLHATAFAQAGKPIPVFGTTHADFFHGPIGVTRPLTRSEIAGEYEKETGQVICAAFRGRDSEAIPAVLVRGHAPFAWGPTAAKAVENAVAVELCAQLALFTLQINPSTRALNGSLHRRHFTRKHGPAAYYGQP
jgi:L-ribulose-5-phosphate 4-epimerase